MSDKKRMTPAEHLMNDAHTVIARLNGTVPQLISERDKALAQSDHYKSQALVISHAAMAVANENIALNATLLTMQGTIDKLNARVAELESILKGVSVFAPEHPSDGGVEAFKQMVTLEHPDAIGSESA